MPHCSSIVKSTGVQCVHQAKPGFTTCGKHMASAQQVQVTQCVEMKRNGTRCTKDASENGICSYHFKMRTKRAAFRDAEIVWDHVLDRVWAVDAAPRTAAELKAIIAILLTPGPFREEMRVMLEIRVPFELAHYRRTMRALGPLKGDLHRIALDGQSVHTTPVTQQTNAATDKILAEEEKMTETDQETLAGVHAVLAKASCEGTMPTKVLVKIQKDIAHWYDVVTCRTDCDYLYRRTLRGVWSLIRSSNHFDDLCQRLLQELNDSLSTCCEGHISRLCNVFVGFDDAFVPTQTVGEMLQQKMAEIAAKECCVEEKVGHAWAVFEELKTPLVERSAWIEAF